MLHAAILDWLGDVRCENGYKLRGPYRAASLYPAISAK